MYYQAANQQLPAQVLSGVDFPCKQVIFKYWHETANAIKEPELHNYTKESRIKGQLDSGRGSGRGVWAKLFKGRCKLPCSPTRSCARDIWNVSEAMEPGGK